ncbi:Uncharacterised protein [Vibrio cholerae]|nr:Uncharacterised protein [Vibrio cholerae]
MGSSSSSKLGFCHTINASTKRAFSPPEKGATFSSAFSPWKPKLPK